MLQTARLWYSRARRVLSDPMLAELRRPWVQELGIRSIVDVGANEGQFAKMARTAFPGVPIVSFEPIQVCWERLEQRFASDQLFVSKPYALGATRRRATILKSSFSPSSSLRPMAERHREAFPHTVDVSECSTEVYPLDDVSEVRALPGPLLLKVDVQGFEDEVLKGAAATLPRVRLAILETSLEELYQGELLLPELQGVMREHHFRFVGIVGIARHPRTGRQLQVDALFENPHVVRGC